MSPMDGGIIRCGFEVMDVSAVEDVHYTITLLLNTFVMWNDSRLIINDTIMQDLAVVNRWYSLSPELTSKIWQPELLIRNLRKEIFTRADAIDKGQTVLLTTEKHQRFYIQKQAVVKISCVMDFSLFPFDRHNCPYVVGAKIN